ncbi:hypothetical protein SteCoe_25929 [Stentor coeruleus]|uniref:Acyl-coenzyme A oxidase n=1 Tax=Stentor coeruleus TaxID=5963 RepID=A0A1R2BE05_9CILI|nr:hypothetical protein SteCoe_25929 [Stentor coeruleus]
MTSNTRRLDVVKNHLSSKFPTMPFDDTLEKYRQRTPSFNKDSLFAIYMGSHHKLIRMLRESSKNSPLINHTAYTFGSREDKHQQIYRIVGEIYTKTPLTYEEDLQDPTKKLNILQVLCEFDIASGTRCTVHMSLYIDTIQNLGTAKHRARIDRAYKLLDYGSFAMTELGHGSNVAGLEVTATYDKNTKEFIINSPTKTSAKWWIGAVGKTANMSVVWAQLIIDGDNKGVHVFLVPIRDFDTHEACKGVVLGDCGEKNELNGIDNGFLIFNNYRVPYDCLLDKYSSITNEGKYKSPIKNKQKRLGIMLAGLLRGRFAVSFASEISLRNAMTIALRFAAIRKQFSEPEKSILDYQTHRTRLIPHFCRMFAIRSGIHYLQNYLSAHSSLFYKDPECEELNELHAILSVFKALASTYAFNGIQECRESTGGHGYSIHSGLARLRGTADVLMTWEGDNTVLVQQTSKYILKQIQRLLKGAKNTSTTLQFVRLDYEISTWPINSIKDLTVENVIKVYHSYINSTAKQTMQKLQENIQKYDNTTDVWNNTQTSYAQTLASVFGEFLYYQEMVSMCKNIANNDPVLAGVIMKIPELYVIDCWERRQRVYIELGCKVESYALLRDRHIELCNEIGNWIVPMIDALASCDNYIGSVYGYADGQAYNRLVEAVENEQGVYEKPTWLSDIHNVRKAASS